MAKRRRKAETRLETAAAGAGTALGHVAARVDALGKQRKAVATELREFIATAQQMLEDLGEDAAYSGRRVRRTVSKAAGKVKRKRRLSAQGRANIIAAAKKRWAAYNAQKKK